ncbi:MAG: hypothetical protein BGO67_01455 [Alphaproteobacteria bacterium 41-28]|nr:MAG: hypothetical protein BGO67_01455 [Alphaproteobacteria bacterium 41-28]
MTSCDCILCPRRSWSSSVTPISVILGKKCFVLAKARALAFLGRGSLRPQDPRVKKSPCFSYENQGFSSPRMTPWGKSKGKQANA